jgi:hypothetical protein
VFICQFDVKHIMMLPITAIALVLMESIYTITSIAACPIRLDGILAITSVSTFIAVVILYVICYVNE